MPNVWKFLSRPKAEPYRFPDAGELVPAQPEPVSDAPPPVSGESPPEAAEAANRESPEAEREEEAPDQEQDPVSYAQIQAAEILKDAERLAAEIVGNARRDAQEQAEAIREEARQAGLEAGQAEGFAQGTRQALEEGRQARETQAQAMEAQVAEFLERAGQTLDRQMDDNVEELRDLALAIAEKVVSVSLKSSSEVICRMIQAAIDKRKRREWVHIYIAECDAKQLTKLPQSLTSALSALSGRVRIIPMADDEAGTCIIEMPDEIIDASAATQLNNIRTMLSDTPTGGTDTNLNFGGGFHVPTDDPSGL